MNSNVILDFFNGFITGVGELANWLITPIGIGDWSIAPLGLLGISGLIIFLGIAIIKWAIS